MDDIKLLFTEVIGISAAQNDKEIVKQGSKTLKDLMLKSNVPVTLEKYGECPTKEYITHELEADDFGEFTHDEMYEMIKKCYK